MITTARLCAGAAVMLAAACAQGDRAPGMASRGEPVGVNSVPAATPADPSPSAMATTTATGSNR